MDSRAPTTSSSKRDSIRSTPSCVARVPASAARGLRRARTPRRSGGRILLDPESRELDDEFSTSVDRAIASTEAWIDRAPDDAEAWFYNGGAYAARVQWRVLRKEKLAAARDGKNIKDALERAIELDPTLEDAYFGVGLYKYLRRRGAGGREVPPLPAAPAGGDRKEGLDQMLRARNRGRLLQGEADYQLHVIYLWYERQTPRALQLLQSLHDRYPANPLLRVADGGDPGRLPARRDQPAWPPGSRCWRPRANSARTRRC